MLLIWSNTNPDMPVTPNSLNFFEAPDKTLVKRYGQLYGSSFSLAVANLALSKRHPIAIITESVNGAQQLQQELSFLVPVNAVFLNCQTGKPYRMTYFRLIRTSFHNVWQLCISYPQSTPAIFWYCLYQPYYSACRRKHIYAHRYWYLSRIRH